MATRPGTDRVGPPLVSDVAYRGVGVLTQRLSDPTIIPNETHETH